jgi:broad specificity phosphatase PhoE
MENKTKIILIRHGQSIGNATRTILGHTDLDLSDLGYRQAEATAKALKNEKIDVIYSSDLKRAYNTAVFHAKMRNIDVMTSENLREAYLGAWEGQTMDNVIAKWGREAVEIDWLGNFGLFTFPDGEKIMDAGRRFYNEILRISEANQGKTVLIAAHAAVIRAFWSMISDIKPENIADELPFPSNASYSICYFENGKIVPFEYSIDEHLAEIGITKVKLI